MIIMSEKDYNPFINELPENKPVSEHLNDLDKNRTYVINEKLMNQYISEQNKLLEFDPTMLTVGNHYLVGECHYKSVPDKYKPTFDTNLTKSEIIIVESKFLPEKLESNKGKTFSGEAQKHAITQGKTLIDLNEAVKEYYPTASTLWAEKGVLNTEINVPVLECLNVCIHYLNAENKSPELVKRTIEGFADIATGIFTKKELGTSIPEKDQELTNKVALITKEVLEYALQDTGGMCALLSLLLNYHEVDGKMRDTAYNMVIRKILNENNNKETTVVVGKNHSQAVELALKGVTLPDDEVKHVASKANDIFYELDRLRRATKDKLRTED
jgi:hypothetical protein